MGWWLCVCTSLFPLPRADGEVKRYVLDLARLFPPLQNSLTPHPRLPIATLIPLSGSRRVSVCQSREVLPEVAALLGVDDVHQVVCIMEDGNRFVYSKTPHEVGRDSITSSRQFLDYFVIM